MRIQPLGLKPVNSGKLILALKGLFGISGRLLFDNGSNGELTGIWLLTDIGIVVGIGSVLSKGTVEVIKEEERVGF